MSARTSSLVGLIAGWAIGGCTCRPEPVPEAPIVHYDGWQALIDAAARGDRETAQKVARELDGGPLAAGDEAGAAQVGSALGFVGIAEDAEEVAHGVAAAAAGCGECHAARAVRPYEDRPPWGHRSGAAWALWGLVWGEPAAPGEGAGEIEAALAQAWAEPVDTDAQPEKARAARLIAACQGCHR